MNREMRTARLLLRRPRRCDLADATEIFGGRRRARGMLRGFIYHWWRYGYGYWTIEDGSGVVGFGGLSRGDDHAGGYLNLYYEVRPEVRGRGYAVEMARCALDWAQTQMPGKPVVIAAHPDNAPSLRVAEKLGFVRDGTVLRHGVELARFRAPAGRRATHGQAPWAAGDQA